MKTATISEEYRAEQQRLHETADYGTASSSYAPLIQALLQVGRLSSISDYGAGRCNLLRALKMDARLPRYYPYDPAFPQYGEPKPADLVVSIDVLEHIEPDLLEACLDEIASITRRLLLLTIHTGPAKKRLSDGRNAHLLQRPLAWWLPKLRARFDLIHCQKARKGFFVLACPKGMYGRLDNELNLAAVAEVAAQVAPPRSSRLGRAKARVRETIELAQRDVGTLWLIARDKRTPWYVRAIAGAVSLSAVSPIDITPDFIPGVGFLDDFILLVLSTFLAARLVPAPLLADLRGRAATVDRSQASKGLASLCVIWAVAGMVALSRF